MLTIACKPNVTSRIILPCRQFWASHQLFTEEKTVIETPVVVDILEDLKKPELSEEEIMQKQFQSRIPELDYRKHVLKEAVPIDTVDGFRIDRLRIEYGRFGKATNLNPGICWPSREEVLETMKYDNILDPPLKVKLKNIEEKRTKEALERKAYEDEVDRNMSNHDKWLAEFHDKKRIKEEKALQLRQDREKLVEEVSEHLGYAIDPRDPRFKDAVEQRNKAKKKEMKAQKQQESYAKMLEKLKKIAQSKTT